MENEIVLFESEDDQVKLNVEFDGETVWLTKEQMAALFGRDRSVISRHISNIFREGEILEEGNVHYLHIANSDKPVAFYNLDAIISVGYRVKSKRASNSVDGQQACCDNMCLMATQQTSAALRS